jgi:hypothetical protein
VAHILGGKMKRIYSDSVENLSKDIKIVDPITRHIITNDIGIVYQSEEESKTERLNAEYALVELLNNENFEVRITALQHLLLKKPTIKKCENLILMFLNSSEHEEEVRAIRAHFSKKNIYSWAPIPNWQ